MIDLGVADQTPMATAQEADLSEALQALQMLGFAKTAAEKVLRAIVREEPSATVEELVRMALKRL